MIWNKYKSIAYGYLKNNFFFNEPSIFDRNIIELVGMWNVEKIKMYEKEKSTLTNPFLIFASRVIIKRKEISADCIAFDQFYLINAIIHYVAKWENGVLKAVDDFKFK